jgi:integrase
MALQFSPPQILQDSNSRYFISFRISDRRFRFSSGKVLGLNLNPNKVGRAESETLAQHLQVAFHKALLDGWSPVQVPVTESLTTREAVMQFFPTHHLSEKYSYELLQTKEAVLQFLKISGLSKLPLTELSRVHCSTYLAARHTPSTFNHERQRLSAVLKPALEQLELANPVLRIPQQTTKAVLHQPFESVSEVLEELKEFNGNLYLCCLITYGCLLRPHKEVRELRWSDFLEGLKFIQLPGKRNKSGRVRVVPVPDFVRAELSELEPHLNVFSNQAQPFNPSYFKSLWTRFKAQSQGVGKEQTLYSFRHTAALELFNRTGDIRKLSAAMGHSSLEVTLGYLKHMARTELTADDMPRL